jgi:DNA excision repair protein ERCC-1
LRNLPGFGQVKVKNLKNAFDKPMRNNATRTLPNVAPQTPELAFYGGEVLTTTSVPASVSTKGKEKEIPPAAMRPPREPSPVWDIELDLDEPSSATEKGSPPRTTATFDIELDLN